jgi:hypothetical protein
MTRQAIAVGIEHSIQRNTRYAQRPSAKTL